MNTAVLEKVLSEKEKDGNKQHIPNIMKPNNKHFLINQTIDTTNHLSNFQTLLFLPSRHIPKSNRLVITTTYQSVAPQQERGTKVGVSVKETDRLREGVCEIGFAVVQGAVEREPREGEMSVLEGGRRNGGLTILRLLEVVREVQDHSL